MALSCLICHTLKRTDSETDMGYEHDKPRLRVCCVKVERSWSAGNLTPPRYEQIRNESRVVTKKARNGHRRLHTTGAVACEGLAVAEEPRLLRSCGMRRDWSFEDLEQRWAGKRNEGRGF
ncbi:hypothetical protein HHK36_000529 [Tetracentron sinense]|uniref:Uncharacterized protein n=1 Tax=Tetracentron sinense TaxID=13715 RepID=A0A834ZSB1_TETSI|nr:hypothetical protein HHK36_000509 [Tetracentron sinense]KAF8412561.1 hypothetical protein HHK36_000529 [Tetracentron sinense]